MRQRFDTPKKKKKVGRMSFDINKPAKGGPTRGICPFGLCRVRVSRYLGILKLLSFKISYSLRI